MQNAKKNVGKTKDPVEKLRLQILARGGCGGIKGIGRTFKIIDDDGNKTLSMSEFKKGLRDYGLDLENINVDETFQCFDADGSGSIDFEEFLRKLRPPMNNFRRELINKAF